MAQEPANFNLFMVCHALKNAALSSLPPGYSLEFCRPEDLAFWKGMHFDDAASAAENRPYMDAYFERVYAPHGNAFYERCLLAREPKGGIVGSCFAWPAYGRVSTIHWFKVLKGYEGRGIGRGLLSAVMQGIRHEGYPVCLHTQPESYRAIKLYSDFGFCLMSDACIGRRQNDLEAGLAYLQKHMPGEAFKGLCFAPAPRELLAAAAAAEQDEF